MTLDPDALLARPLPETRAAWGPRDAILYALGLGAGLEARPELAHELHYVQERGLRMLPMQAVVLAADFFFIRDHLPEIDFSRVVHGEQQLEIHAPLPLAGEGRARARVLAVIDKGAGRGTVLVTERRLEAAATGAPLATLRQSVFVRGQGGFGASRGAPLTRAPVPERTPDARLSLPSSPQAALIYRLSGDLNPLHSDPQVAQAAGFPAPILHGLASWGIAGRAVIALACGGDERRLRGLDARFTAPVFPGETFEVALWRLSEGEVAFRLTVPARDLVALDEGRARIAPA